MHIVTLVGLAIIFCILRGVPGGILVLTFGYLGGLATNELACKLWRGLDDRALARVSCVAMPVFGSAAALVS